MYLIDGNNVIGQRVGWHRDKPGSRRRLIEDLVRFTWIKRTALTVVFDGAPSAEFPHGSSYKGVRIFYPAKGEDADSRIVEIVEAEQNQNNLIVVTSDRQLAARVRVCGVRVIRSGVFRQMLDELSLQNSNHHLNPDHPELTEWLRYFGTTEDGEDQ